MKKTIIILALLAFVAGFSSMGLAAQKCNTNAGDSMDVDDGTYTLTFNFSPSVHGCYWTEATSNTEQWFAIGTFHVGGDEAYATASNFTSLYTLNGGTDDLSAKDTDTVFANIVATEGSDGDWTGWSKK